MTDCRECRVVLSARLDGEDAGDQSRDADAHLSACIHCRQWMATAVSVTRWARTQLVTAAPPVSDTVLSAAPGPNRARVAAALRVSLGVIGLMQVLLGLAQVTSFYNHSGYLHVLPAAHVPAEHLWHESAAWNAAIGAGFVWIASRRSRPVSIIPTLTAFVALLVVLSISDVFADRVDVSRLLSHGVVLVGYLILLALTRPAFDFGEPAPTADGRRKRWWRVRFDTDAASAGGGVNSSYAEAPVTVRVKRHEHAPPRRAA